MGTWDSLGSKTQPQDLFFVGCFCFSFFFWGLFLGNEKELATWETKLGPVERGWKGTRLFSVVCFSRGTQHSRG